MLTLSSLRIAEREVRGWANDLAKIRRRMTSEGFQKRWLTAAAHEMRRQIRKPSYFYSKRVIPKGGRASRSMDLSRRSVRVATPQTPIDISLGRGRTSGVSVVMGGPGPASHAYWLERGRKGNLRTFPLYTRGRTGPLPAQRIFHRATSLFATHAQLAYSRQLDADIASVYRGTRLSRVR